MRRGGMRGRSWDGRGVQIWDTNGNEHFTYATATAQGASDGMCDRVVLGWLCDTDQFAVGVWLECCPPSDAVTVAICEDFEH